LVAKQRLKPGRELSDQPVSETGTSSRSCQFALFEALRLVCISVHKRQANLLGEI